MNSSVWAVWAAQAARKQKWIWVILSNFWGWFFQLFVGKIFFKSFKQYFSVCIEKLHKMPFIIYFFSFENFWKVEKIGYHSNFNFNFECNTEGGSKESLSIALGLFQNTEGLLAKVKCSYRVPKFKPSRQKKFHLLVFCYCFSSQCKKNSGGWVWIWARCNCTLPLYIAVGQ